ncbi:hypothetical protein [Clostridium beijerinckii]|uniref:hypothetical protein n=1 Tax=Clostridium beijerinckii TaxID=1520 RepID=UPI001F39B367|nr:hypothetical protein [Clostridium beijerinckii]
MPEVLLNLEEVKHSVNELFYNSSSIELMCNNRIKLKHALDVLENSITTTLKETIICVAKECELREGYKNEN